MTRALDPAIVAEARHTHPRTLEPGGPAESPDYLDPGGFAIAP